MIKEKPILFNTEMVGAILRKLDPKTATRRTRGLDKINEDPNDWEFIGLGINEDNGNNQAMFSGGLNKSEFIKCPYGKVGDRLWVRETMEVDSVLDLYYLADNTIVDVVPPDNYYYREPEYIGKIPSIVMPRWASRINLEITDIRVERVKDITVEGIKAEGVIQRFPNVNDKHTPDILLGSFMELWDSINLKRNDGAYSWRKNPWVWVVEFKRVEV